MKIYINNTPHTINKDSILNSVFPLLDISSSQGLALAVNNRVIPRSQWNGYILREGDNILLVKASQGG